MLSPHKILFHNVTTKYKEIWVLIYRHPGISLELHECSSESDVIIKKIILVLIFEGLHVVESWL